MLTLLVHRGLVFSLVFFLCIFFWIFTDVLGWINDSTQLCSLECCPLHLKIIALYLHSLLQSTCSFIITFTCTLSCTQCHSDPNDSSFNCSLDPHFRVPNTVLSHIVHCLKSHEIVIVNWAKREKAWKGWSVPNRLLLFYFVVVFDIIKGIPGQDFPSVVFFG